jgi:hypothetical protein
VFLSGMNRLSDFIFSPLFSGANGYFSQRDSQVELPFLTQGETRETEQENAQRWYSFGKRV